MTAKASTKAGRARQEAYQRLEAFEAMVTAFIAEAKETNLTPKEIERLVSKHHKHRKKHPKHHKPHKHGGMIFAQSLPKNGPSTIDREFVGFILVL
jgi:hypothetical protein